MIPPPAPACLWQAPKPTMKECAPLHVGFVTSPVELKRRNQRQAQVVG